MATAQAARTPAGAKAPPPDAAPGAPPGPSADPASGSDSGSASRSATSAASSSATDSSAAPRQAPVRQFLRTVRPTGRARPFSADEIIVSKTDAKGVITYANDVFLRVAQMEEETALGAPHSLVRHPDMPRCVFKLMWDRIAAGEEIFAYVLNLASSGDHYWVLAHVTPSWDAAGRIAGYHSSRRAPSDAAVRAAAALYAQLKRAEDAQPDKAAAIAAGAAALGEVLKQKGLRYDELVFAL